MSKHRISVGQTTLKRHINANHQISKQRRTFRRCINVDTDTKRWNNVVWTLSACCGVTANHKISLKVPGNSKKYRCDIGDPAVDNKELGRQNFSKADFSDTFFFFFFFFFFWFFSLQFLLHKTKNMSCVNSPESPMIRVKCDAYLWLNDRNLLNRTLSMQHTFFSYAPNGTCDRHVLFPFYFDKKDTPIFV